MAENEIHKNDIGTIFEVTIKDGSSTVDVSSASSSGEKELLFLKPDKTSLTVDSSFKTDGTDGIIQYTTVANDLNVAGRWKLQAHLTLTAGEWKSDVANFIVHDNIV